MIKFQNEIKLKKKKTRNKQKLVRVCTFHLSINLLMRISLKYISREKLDGRVGNLE